MAAPECVICLCEINNKPIQCPYCQHVAHVTCTKQYLLTDMKEPSCFHDTCMKEWSREVLDAMPLPKTWVANKLSQHRTEVLYQRERSLLPATAERVASRANLDIVKNEINRLTVLLNEQGDNEWFAEAVASRNAVTREHAEECIHISEVIGIKGRIKFLKTCLASMEVAQRVVEGRDVSPSTQRSIDRHEQEYMFRSGSEMTRRKTSEHDGEEDEPKTKTLFPCPVASCKGFIGSYNGKCILCETLVCRACREIISATVDVSPEDVRAATERHACDQSTLDTLALIASDSKKCPSCRVEITRSQGCPVMFCTRCNTFFSWTTLKRLQGQPHNPHFAEYQRSLRKGRPDARARSECSGQVPNKNDFMQRVTELGVPITWSTRPLAAEGIRAIEIVLHIQDQEIVPEPEPQQVNLLARLAYLRGEKSEERFKQIIKQHDKKLSLQREQNQVWEMFCAEIAIGLQQTIIDKASASKSRAMEFLSSIEGLVAYVNKAMKAIGKRYNMIPMLIGKSMTSHHRIHNALDTTYVYEVRKQAGTNLEPPRSPIREGASIFDAKDGPVTRKSIIIDQTSEEAKTFIGAMQVLVTPTKLSEDVLYKRPRINDSDSD